MLFTVRKIQYKYVVRDYPRTYWKVVRGITKKVAYVFIDRLLG